MKKIVLNRTARAFLPKIEWRDFLLLLERWNKVRRADSVVKADVADCPAASLELHRNLLKSHPPYERMHALPRVPLEFPAKIKFRPAAESRHIVNQNLRGQVKKNVVNRLVDCLSWNHDKKL